MSFVREFFCGFNSTHPSIREIDLLLRSRIDRHEAYIDRFIKEPEKYPEIIDYGLYSGRCLLEMCLVSVVLQVDPFRVLAAFKVQGHPKFDIGTRSPMAINWTGEVLPSDKNSGQADIWDVNQSMEKVSRAILSDHTGDIFWLPALERFSDEFQGETKSIVVRDLLNVEPISICQRFRGKVRSVYSKLSKGVHNELLRQQPLIDNPISVTDILKETVLNLSEIGVVSQFFDKRTGMLTKEAMIAALVKVEEVCLAPK